VGSVANSLLVSGFDVREVALPDDAEVLLPPLALPAHDDFKEAVQRAFDEPIEGPPLAKRVKPNSKVTVVLDDFTLPVPPASRDCRREMLEGTLESLGHFGVKPGNVTVLVATGLSRQWRPAELTELLGPRATAMANLRAHDAEAGAELVRIADEPQGPIEVSRTLIEADLVIHLSVVSMPLHAGTFALVAGTAGYRTARVLNAPQMFEHDDNPFVPGSAWHRAHTHIGAMLGAKVPVLQLAAVQNNELWPPAVSAILRRDEGGLSRPLQMWNAMPEAVRHRAARVMRSSFRPIAALCGPPDAVAPRALELFLRQHEVEGRGEADVLLFGLPDLGPYSVGTAQNPVLAANLALGFISNLFTQKPLIRKGGVIVFLNPLQPKFDARAHRPHLELYERVLRLEREPLAIHERYEPYLASKPELVADYQRRYAFHGAHPLICWYQCSPARRRASRIIVAHGDPRACARLGFMGAADAEQALNKAREVLGIEHPRVRVLELPPPFVVRI
jgi:lactate racemase